MKNLKSKLELEKQGKRDERVKARVMKDVNEGLEKAGSAGTAGRARLES